MSDTPSRILRFAVTSALLVGASGCTDPKISSNPGPVNPPSASPSAASSPAASPAESPATSPAASPADLRKEDLMTNPGPEPIDEPEKR
jgi:hypothetical protein